MKMGRVTKCLPREMGLSPWLSLWRTDLAMMEGETVPVTKWGYFSISWLLLQEDEDVYGGSWCSSPAMVVLATPTHLAEEGFAYTCCVRKSRSNLFQQIVKKIICKCFKNCLTWGIVFVPSLFCICQWGGLSLLCSYPQAGSSCGVIRVLCLMDKWVPEVVWLGLWCQWLNVSEGLVVVSALFCGVRGCPPFWRLVVSVGCFVALLRSCPLLSVGRFLHPAPETSLAGGDSE